MVRKTVDERYEQAMEKTQNSDKDPVFSIRVSLRDVYLKQVDLASAQEKHNSCHEKFVNEVNNKIAWTRKVAYAALGLCLFICAWIIYLK